jgi:hypothetical protein
MLEGFNASRRLLSHDCIEAGRAIQSGEPPPFATSLAKPDCEPWPYVSFCPRRKNVVMNLDVRPCLFDSVNPRLSAVLADSNSLQIFRRSRLAKR